MFENINYKEIFAHNEKVNQDNIEIAHKLIEEVSVNHIELGQGDEARVYFSHDVNKQDFCVKELHLPPRIFVVNTIQQEMSLQEQAIQSGVRSPKPVLCLETDKGESFLVMETIKGHNLLEIIEKGLALPENFKQEFFWDELKNMLDKLHAEQIYHRDIKLANIMMDYTDGSPIIIDYGRAARVVGEDNPYIDIDYGKNEQINYKDDLKALNSVKSQFTSYLTNRLK
ncbi:phosphotransferase [Patescibacteria group bacterium]|nr:phosphotransferase [Patescibacteria group bacterium]